MLTMLTKRNNIAAAIRYCLVAVLLLMSFWARSQGAVYVLKAGEAALSGSAPEGASAAQPFDLHRNLIFFPARINGRQGNFILDTGAPTLLLNARHTEGAGLNSTGLGAGGEVAIGQQKVELLEFAGQKHGRVWALSLDLRAMEARTGRTIDGFIGYEQIWNRELRIDYPNHSFSILKSTRRPVRNERTPDYVLDLEFSGHLPLVTFRFGKRRLKFILDTGAAANLLDERYVDIAEATGQKMNIQGIDGLDQDCDIVRLPSPEGLALNGLQRSFVKMNLEHLQESGEPVVAGILGSAFLNQYCIGIDYRRGKLYIWKTSEIL